MDADIANLTSIGVEIRCDVAVSDPESLKADYNAVIVATGTQVATRMDVPGEDAQGSVNGLDFLAEVANGADLDLTGKRVVVVGGGNVAMDAARVSLRLGAAEARVAYRRTRAEMPAHHVESKDAEAEGAVFELLVAPTEVLTRDGKVTGVRLPADAARRPGRLRAPQPRADPRQRVRPRLRPGDLHHRHEPRPEAVRSPRRQARPDHRRPEDAADQRRRTCSPPAT